MVCSKDLTIKIQRQKTMFYSLKGFLMFASLIGQHFIFKYNKLIKDQKTSFNASDSINNCPKSILVSSSGINFTGIVSLQKAMYMYNKAINLIGCVVKSLALELAKCRGH